jgi:hypothetical protein
MNRREFLADAAVTVFYREADAPVVLLLQARRGISIPVLKRDVGNPSCNCDSQVTRHL